MTLKFKVSALLAIALLTLIAGRALKGGLHPVKPSTVLAAGFNEEKQPSPYTIRVGVGLAVLPVTVTDNHHHRVGGLTKDNFQVLEDGRPQKIIIFEGQDAPVTVGLVVDNSLSMEPKRNAVVAAALAFVGSSNPQDQIFVVTFNQTIHMELPQNEPFTKSPQELRNALLKLQPMGETALYDALIVALDHLKTGTGERKYLIVVSDGGDNASRRTLADVVNLAKSSDAEIYSVAIINENYSDENPDVLRKLSKLTGGEYFQPEAVPEVIDTCKTIARGIRQQYTLGYVPSNQEANGRFRKVKVIASAPNSVKLHVRTREGYMVPPPTLAQAASSGDGGR